MQLRHAFTWGVGTLMAVHMPALYATELAPVSVLEKVPEELNQPLIVQSESISTPQTPSLYLGKGIVANINQAILQRDWIHLEQYLKEYQQQETIDPLLNDYALGILYRAKTNYTEAIALYEHILQHYPQFDYIRFDLAVMLFENRQYQQAKQHFQQAKPQLNAPLQQLTERYLNEIKQRQRFQPTVSLNYERTNNVNQAAKATEIHWQGRVWTKSPDSLPQKAEGVRYGLGLTKTQNVHGNHFLHADIDAKGVYYWDNPAFNEQTVAASLGYQYQSFHKTWSVSPFGEYTWLDQRDYVQETGVRLHLHQRLAPRWRMNLTGEWSQRNYLNEKVAQHYDAKVTRFSANMQYQPLPHTVMFVGGDISDDRTQDHAFASQRYGINVGVLAEQPQRFGGRVSLRYAQRQFKEPNRLLYQFTRQDHEYFVQLSAWHHRLNYKGFMPKWHIRYQYIDSNMDALYSRDHFNSFISIEKRY